MLTRMRALGVAKKLTEIPELRALGDRSFFQGIVRDWVKVLGGRMNLPPEQNPAVLWTAAIVGYYYPEAGGTLDNCQLKNMYGKLLITSDNLGGRFSPNPRYNSPEERGVSVWQFLRNGFLESFLRREDVLWIAKQLSLGNPRDTVFKE